MNENNTTASGGVGFVGLLTLIFITLKLLHVIDWRWVWVLSPVWIMAGIMVIFGLVACVVVAAQRGRKRK